MPANQGGSSATFNAVPGLTSWANGWEDFDPNDKDNTNVLCLLGMNDPHHGTQFGPYVKNVGIYKCPCDNWTALQQGLKLPRLRSISMNAFVGTGDQQTETGWKDYSKMTDITAPPPVLLWVISDEHPDSINDAWLTDDPGVLVWGDLPGSYHDAGDVIGFADGHVEYHKWMDAGTVQPVQQYTHEGFADPQGRDTAWFYARTSIYQQ